MKKLLSPRGYLSWTQISMWQRTPLRYTQKYMLNEDIEFKNSGIEYGKKTSEALETGDYGDDDLLRAVGSLLPRYSSSEHELKVTMETSNGAVPLLGKLDTFDPPTWSFREYKTGRVPWNQSKAQKHKQLLHYTTMIWLIVGKIPPEVHLDWIETEEVLKKYKDEDGHYYSKKVVQFTGRIESYPVKYKLGDVIEYMSIVGKVAREIDAEYRKHLKSLT